MQQLVAAAIVAEWWGYVGVRLGLLSIYFVCVLLQLRRWEEEGGMPVLVGTERFVSRPMSGGYKHPDIIRWTTRSAAYHIPPAHSVGCDTPAFRPFERPPAGG